jgi:endonuclease/exonuclease/phosphatase family metal-dependent hydrolase
MVVHAKSKGIFDAVDMVRWERENERNRRKLFAEATSIRTRVDQWLDDGQSVVVMGDVNDGPGMDNFEFRFGRSAVEIIMGSLFQPSRVLANHAGQPRFGRFGWEPSSARFRDRFTEDLVNVLIDHIVASQDLPVVANSPHKIWNPFQDDDARPLRDELVEASDHFPVTLDLDIP